MIATGCGWHCKTYPERGHTRPQGKAHYLAITGRPLCYGTVRGNGYALSFTKCTWAPYDDRADKCAICTRMLEGAGR